MSGWQVLLTTWAQMLLHMGLSWAKGNRPAFGSGVTQEFPGSKGDLDMWKEKAHCLCTLTGWSWSC